MPVTYAAVARLWIFRVPVVAAKENDTGPMAKITNEV
jgi:hypothetical protein